MISVYKHAKTCTGTPPATLEPTCITLVGFEEVVWVADASGVRYQSADVPGGAPVVAISALSALPAFFLLVLHLRRTYGSRRRTGRQSQAGLGPVVALIALAAMAFGITELALGAGWAAWITAVTPPLVYAASADFSSLSRTVVRWPARS